MLMFYPIALYCFTHFSLPWPYAFQFKL